MDAAPRGPRFPDVVSSEEEIGAIPGQPSPRVLAKVTDTLDGVCRAFIARSTFVLIASSDGGGNLDDRTLAVPERPGNRRADTFRNVLRDPGVGLTFLVPGERGTLRVSGTAAIVRDAALREGMALGGKVPDLAPLVSVREAFMHRAECAVRSRSWEPASWPAPDGLPSLAEAMVARRKLDIPVAEMQARIDDDARDRLH